MKKYFRNIDPKTKALFLGGLTFCLFTSWVAYDKGLINPSQAIPNSDKTDRPSSIIFPKSDQNPTPNKTEIYKEEMSAKPAPELSSEDFFGKEEKTEPSIKAQRHKEARKKYGDLFENIKTPKGKTKPKDPSPPATEHKTAYQDDAQREEASPQRFSFYSIEKEQTKLKNPNPRDGASCVVHNEQTLRNGQTLRLRLEEDLKTGGGVILSRSTLLYGTAAFGKERIKVVVKNANIGNQIIPVNMDIYGIDGLEGVPYTEIPGAGDTRDQLIDHAVNDFSRTSRTPSLLEGLSHTVKRTSKTPKITLPNEMQLIIK